MEIHLTAEFKDMSSLEQAVEELRLQGVLDIRFDNQIPIKVDFQADTVMESLENSLAGQTYTLQVSVEKSRYRQSEDIIAKYAGALSGTF
ncbi:hypothetical protein [Paenibacillus eucommiae]|uniref:Uncharacterized protein n=1 Tax=Paenibacillus eucommiae TaxID=1355755 RepID=A0ABS4J466_9BACL|nr:hypothetical protein [Paenibacillus eucommiae]MBP1994632.1 hypothetical protein [Paenibacillus eucommiae]